MYRPLVRVAFLLNRYVQYNSTSLERLYKFDLLTENDLGVAIDLINPDTYRTEYDGRFLSVRIDFVYPQTFPPIYLYSPVYMNYFKIFGRMEKLCRAQT